MPNFDPKFSYMQPVTGIAARRRALSASALVALACFAGKRFRVSAAPHPQPGSIPVGT